jgi:hypothetical protein
MQMQRAAYPRHIFFNFEIYMLGGDMVKTDLRAIQHYKAQDERV